MTMIYLLAMGFSILACSYARGETVGRWAGDGNALDTASTNHGTLINGATYAEGRINQAFSLDGSDDYVALPDAASLLVSNSQGTISAWVYPAAVGGNDMIAVFGSGADGQGIGLGIYGNVRIYHHTGTYDWQSSVPVSPDCWTFLTYTWDATTEAIYTNGVLSESRARGAFSYVPGQARIGHGFWGDPANNFPGKIDQVMVFTEALNASQIAALAVADTPSVSNAAPASGAFTNTATLIFKWQFTSPVYPPQKTYRLLIGSPGFTVTNFDSGVVTSSDMQHSNTFSSLPDGIYEWKVIATDQNNDAAESEPWSFGKDMTWPDQPTYNTASGCYVTSSNQLLDIDFQDNVQLSSVAYQVDGSGTSYMVASNIFASRFTNGFSLAAAWNSMTPGYHTLKFTIRDRIPHVMTASSDFAFYKDETPPPAPDYHTAEYSLFEASPLLDIDFQDIVGLNRLEYSLDSSNNWVLLAQDLPGCTYTANWSLSPTVWNGLSNGLHVIYFRITDDAGLEYVTPDADAAFAFSKGILTRVIGLSGNLMFGNVITGQTATATLTITNSGNAALAVSSITYPGGFSGAWNGTVPAGAATNVTVTFSPVALQAYGGTVTVASDKTSGENTIGASGMGVAAPQPGQLCFSAGTYSSQEGIKKKILVKRVNGSIGTVSVKYVMKPKTALAWQDYTPKTGTLTWTNGQTAAKAITITIKADGQVEGNETFQVLLKNPVRAALKWPYKATITILSNSKGGKETESVTAIRMEQLAEALDGKGLIWLTSARSPWTKQGLVTVDGEDAAISGQADLDRVSWLQTDLEGAGKLEFDWLVKGTGKDTGLVFLNGKVRRALVPGYDWAHEDLILGDGRHTVRWVFVGDDGIAPGAVYLDQVNWEIGSR